MDKIRTRAQAVLDGLVVLAVLMVGAVELVAAELWARAQGRPGPLTVVAVAVTLTACGPGSPTTPDPTMPLVTTGPIPVPGTADDGTGALDSRGGAR